MTIYKASEKAGLTDLLFIVARIKKVVIKLVKAKILTESFDMTEAISHNNT
jgi:hypothetical protein